MTTTLPRILCVDDELRVLRGLARTIRHHFDVLVATSGREALTQLLEDPSIEVLCTDFRMPGMDGAEVVRQARAFRPDVTRVLLSGQADLESVARVVNGGGIHRFLIKPCATADLVAALEQGVEIHRLRRAERSLLEGAVVHSVSALTAALALARPRAAGHCGRVTELVDRLAFASGRGEDRLVHAAAALVGLGFLAVPEQVVANWLDGRASAEDHAAIDRVPLTSAHLVRTVPRLAEVGEVLEAAVNPDAASPWTARAIGLARDYVLLADRGMGQEDSLYVLAPSWGRLDPLLYESLQEVLAATGDKDVVEIGADELRPGMVLVSDLVAEDDAVLMSRGIEITVAVLERVHNYRRLFQIREPVRVLEG